MLKILLIEADSYWITAREDLRDLEMVVPPIGLVYIATYIREKFGESIRVKIVSRLVDCLSDADLLSILKDYDPDVVGIRGLYVFQEMFHKTAALVKKSDPKITVFGGGPYTASLEEASKDSNVDCFVLGEGELTFAEIIGRLLENNDYKDIQGIAFRKDGKVVINPPRPFIEDLDALPFPDYDFIDKEKYSRFLSHIANRRRQGVIFSSRGCPYHCIYCHSIFGKKFRSRSPRNVFNEIKQLHDRFNIKDFYFVDDTFNLDYQRAMEIFDLIIESRMKINLYLSNGIRGDVIDRPFIDKMIRAGVICVAYAFETGSKRLQESIRKFIDLDKLADNINYTCQKDIMVNLSAMIGFPNETLEEAKETLDYLMRFKKIVLPYFFAVKCYPGAEIHERVLSQGVSLEEIKNSCAESFHNIAHVNTGRLSKADFLDLYYGFLQNVFLSKERLVNAIRIQRRFCAEREVLDFYSFAFRKRIEDLEKDVLAYAK